MGTWHIADGARASVEHPTAWKAIKSADHLRAMLRRFASKQPRIVEIRTPKGDSIAVGIGGPFGYVEIIPGPDNSGGPSFAARPDVVTAESSVAFLCGGTPSPIPPKLLLPTETLIELVMRIYPSGEL